MTLLDLIIEKKELSGISREFAQSILDKWLEDNPKVLEKYEEDPERFAKKKEFEKLRSEVRKELREVYGLFFTEQYSAKRKKYFEDLLNGEPEKILELHRSTKERLEYYPFLFKQLFEKIGKPKSILDLGCGFNPFAYNYLGCEPEYHALDIACEDLKLIGEYFEKKGIKHTETCKDLTKIEKLPQTDVTFAFKLFDSLETIERDVTKKILDKITSKHIIVSFPTASIGQKKSIKPRKWFEELVTDRVLDRVTLPNEQFLIITNEK